MSTTRGKSEYLYFYVPVYVAALPSPQRTVHEGRAKRSDERNSGGLVHVCVLVHSACIISYMYVRVYVISPPMARLPCHISHLSLHAAAAYMLWCLWCGYHLMYPFDLMSYHGPRHSCAERKIW